MTCKQPPIDPESLCICGHPAKNHAYLNVHTRGVCIDYGENANTYIIGDKLMCDCMKFTPENQEQGEKHE